MFSLAELRERDDSPREDHFTHFRGVRWEDYERFLEVRGDHSAPRIQFFEGVLEIMSPSKFHERLKSRVGCLFEAYCLELGIPFEPLGSWTLQDKAKKSGAEPDECYLIGEIDPDATRPQLAIEVVWTSGGIDKLEIYRRLGVREVSYFEKGVLTQWARRGDRYEAIERSEVLPELDIDLLLQFIDRPTAYDAIRDYRAALVATPPPTG